MGTLTAGQAHAFVVTVDSVQYDVTTFAGSYNSNIDKFALPANGGGGGMPWWNNSIQAQSIATALGTSLGTPNDSSTQPTGFSKGPYFGDSEIAGTVTKSWTSPPSGGGYLSAFVPKDSVVTWAQLAPVAAPVPGPLPALGAAAAFGFSRKLRNRINARKGDSSRAATL